jgi:hypothetical protein
MRQARGSVRARRGVVYNPKAFVHIPCRRLRRSIWIHLADQCLGALIRPTRTGLVSANSYPVKRDPTRRALALCAASR